MVKAQIENLKINKCDLNDQQLLELINQWIAELQNQNSNMSDDWYGDNNFDMNVYDSYTGTITEGYTHAGTVYKTEKINGLIQTNLNEVVATFDLKFEKQKKIYFFL